MPADLDALLAVLRRRGVATGVELRQALGISQPTLSRLVARGRDALVVLGRARSVRYAARDATSPFAAGVTLYRARPDGRVDAFGTLVPLAGGRTALLRPTGEAWSFPGLPWFVEELRPEGFLGRLLVRAAHGALQLPPDARAWSSEQLLRALAYGFDDLPGDLLVGPRAVERCVGRRLDGVAVVERVDYPRLVAAQLAGEAPRSSAGGEQPKLACVRASTGAGASAGAAEHVLVKYSPPVAESAAARRWADLLRCEALAAQALRAAGYAAARAEYFEHDGRAYLEIVRFDRRFEGGVEGRVAVVSGRLLDAEFVGSGAWVPLADGLARARRLSPTDAELVRFAHHFGGVIGNTDMHLGNLGFFTDDYERFRLAPLYDMLPMGLRPSAQGELPRGEVPWSSPPPEEARAWLRAAQVAHGYLAQVEAEPRLDDAVRAFAAARLRRAEATERVVASWA